MRKNHLYGLFVALIYMVCVHTGAYAQKWNSTYQAYIDQYAWMAVEQMNRYRIPASITLAQGLLESAAGRSTLATQANNHFGIKVSSGWTGPYVLRDDDRANEKFRKYSSAAESFEDHSRFLQKSRYAQLFQLSLTDYKGWAKGLKACGYATSPTYAQKLIDIIETYDLSAYDRGKQPASQGSYVASVTSQTSVTHPKVSKEERYVVQANTGVHHDFFARHPISINNKNYYIRIQQGDDLKTIARECEVSERKLRKYNELSKGEALVPGNILYLKKKRNTADKAFKGHPHTVRPGESMYDIAQMYGLKLKSLYKLNQLMPDYSPRVGDQLRLY